MKAKTKIIVAILIVAVIVVAGYFVFGIIARKPFILSYNSKRAELLGSILVNVDRKDLIPSAVCFAPLTNDGKGYYMPVFFSTDGGKLPQHLIEKYAPENLSISSFGRDISEVSINIASRYWERIELVVIVSNYGDSLQAAPLATWLNAPIIFSGPKVNGFLESRGVRSAIVVGGGDYNVGIKRLNSREAIWSFYLDRLKEKGVECNYIIVTNPKDIDKDVMIPYLSVNSAVLAAFRKALVITGDYTVEKNWIWSIGYGWGDAGRGERGEAKNDTLPEEKEMEIQRAINDKAIKVDNDLDYALKFLSDRGMKGEYVALVGCPVSIPMLYIKNPIWYENGNNIENEDEYPDNGDEYLATESYYADSDIKLDPRKNVKGDYICYGEPWSGYNGSNYEYDDNALYTYEIGVGRILAFNCLDASALIARNLMYEETDLRHSILTSRACGTASQNCAEHQRMAFARNSVISAMPAITRLKGYWSPHEISESHLAGNPAAMNNANFIVYNGHGYPDGWYYWWVHMHEQEESPDTIRTEDVRKLTLKPSVIFSASCLCSALDWPVVWNGSVDERKYEDLGVEMFFSLAVIHAGALAHLGSTELSWGAFIRGEVEGYGDFELATMYFEELLDKDLSIGKAQSSAKQRYYSKYNSSFDKTCLLENVLYGEPGVNP